jgi:hypothetical protein
MKRVLKRKFTDALDDEGVPALIALVILFMPILAVAHDEALALEQTVGNYHIDVRYPFAPRAGVPIHLNFFLQDKANEAQNIPFTDAKILITNEAHEETFAVNLIRKEGVASAVTAVFPQPGTYTLTATFNDNATELARASFQVPVLPPEAEERKERQLIQFNRELAIGFALGILLSFGFARLRRYVPDDNAYR